MKEWNSASRMRVGILRKRKPRKLIVNRKIVINKTVFSHFYLRRVNVTIFTKTFISHLEIIVQRRLRARSTHLETLHGQLPENSGRWHSKYIEELYSVLGQPLYINLRIPGGNFQKCL